MEEPIPKGWVRLSAEASKRKFWSAGGSPRGGAKYDDQPKLKSSGLIYNQTPQVLIGLWGFVLRKI
jgi:hypothetical protein